MIPVVWTLDVQTRLYPGPHGGTTIVDPVMVPVIIGSFARLSCHRSLGPIDSYMLSISVYSGCSVAHFISGRYGLALHLSMPRAHFIPSRMCFWYASATSFGFSRFGASGSQTSSRWPNEV